MLTNLALAWPAVGPDGEPLSMDQRRVDAFMDLLRRVADRRPAPSDAGPAATARSGSCCTRTPSSATAPPSTPPASCAASAHPPRSTRTPRRELARAEIDAGAATRVLLVDGDGVLQRTLRLPEGTARRLDPRPELTDRSPRRPAGPAVDLQTESYEPTVAITDHVRAVHPRCTSYDCARLASRCDLDHDESWPRGPTSVTNLCPRCRRHHELKTRGLVRTRLHPDGSLTTTTLLGTTVTTRPEPVPGHGPGEAYATLHSA